MQVQFSTPGRTSPSVSISYKVAKERSENRTVVVINFLIPTKTNAIYSFLLIKPDLKISPNNHTELFTKGEGISVSGALVEGFKYSFIPKGPVSSQGRSAQIRITLPEGEDKLSSVRSLRGYKVRVNKFKASLYEASSFKNSSSCNTVDIDLEQDLLCDVEDDKKVNQAGAYLPTVESDNKSPVTTYTIPQEVVVGDFLEIKGSGDHSYTHSGAEFAESMTGVFVSSDGAFLFPGIASDENYGVVTQPLPPIPPSTLSIPSDIPQDFSVPFDGWIRLQVPESANKVRFAPEDWFYGDNKDNDGDYRVKIRWKALKGNSRCLME